MGNLKVYGATEEWVAKTGTDKKLYISGTAVSNAKAATSNYNNSRTYPATAGKKYFFSYVVSSTSVGFVTSTSTAIQTYAFIFFASSSNAANATIVPLTDVTPATVDGLEGYTFTIPAGCSYFWIGGMANTNSYNINKFSFSAAKQAKQVIAWSDADFHKIPAAPQLINTNNTKSINRNSYYSGGTWHTTYGLSSSYATSDTLKYLPSSTSQQVVKILVPSTVTSPGFFYGTASGTTLTPEGDCSYTTEAVDNKTLYTVTIPANKVCFVTKYLTGSSGSTTQNYYYEGFVPDDISVDNDWIIGALHKNNGTSWD